MDDIGRNTKNNITNRAPPRFVRVREFLWARGEETKWLVESLKRKTGEEKFGSDALDARARRRATSPRNWTCWQREKRKRKRPAASSLDDDETNEGREETTCRKKRRKETRKTRWVRESGRLATHEWLAKRFVMTSVSSANKEQSLTEKEKKVERDNASKLAHALGIDMTVLNNSMALRALPLHRFGKNRGARSMTKAWKSAAVVHDATYLLYRRNEDDSVVPNENVLPKHVRQTFCDDEIASLARLDVVGKLALKLINETLRTSIKFRKIGTIKKQIERFNGNGDGIQFAAVVAADPRKVYADDEVTPPPKKDEDENIHVSSLPPSEKDISDARHDAKIIRARLLAGIGLNDIVANANIDISALQRKFRVCAVARPNNDGASLYFNANWGPIVLKSLVNRGAYAAGVCEWSDLGVWRGANVEHLRSIFNGKETIKPDIPRTRIVLRFPKKGVGKKGDAVYDEGGSIKIGNIDRVTPVSIAIAVASASVLASEWSEIASKRKKGGVKVLVKSATKGDVRAFAFSATETNGDFSWW